MHRCTFSKNCLWILIAILLCFAPKAARAQTYLYTDFENFTSTNQQLWSTDNGVWHVGTPTVGPKAAYQGLQCASTGLTGNFLANQSSRLISPSFTLPAVPAGGDIMLTFAQWIQYGGDSSGDVEVSTWNGSGWNGWGQISRALTGTSGGWSFTSLMLSQYAGQKIRIGFNHNGGNTVSTGWFIDNVKVSFVPSMPLSQTVNFDNFTSSSWQGWSADNGIWNVGAPTVGPKAAHSGTQAASSGLRGNFPASNDSSLISPTINVPARPAGKSLVLGFWQWFQYSGDSNGDVEVATWNGSGWNSWGQVSRSISGSSGGWAYCTVDLTQYAGQKIMIGFHHNGGTTLSTGWTIDDVTLAYLPEFALNQTVNFAGATPTNTLGWSSDNGFWQVGVPPTGPKSGYDGPKCAYPSLLSSSSQQDSHLLAPVVTLPNVASGQVLTLGFWHWYQFASDGSGDVEVTTWNGSGWNSWGQVTNSFTGDSGGWTYTTVDVTAYAGQRILIGFHSFLGTTVAANWYIDDVTILLPSPIVSKLSPTSGPAGTTVTISGTYLSGATQVKFNGAPAVTPADISDSSITATVPVGATTGRISVTTPAGSSFGPVFTVPTPLAVTKLSFTPNLVCPSMTTTGTVTLSGVAPAGGANVTLTPSNGAVTVPASVPIPAGATTATFMATAASVTSPTVETVTATLNSSSVQGSVTVDPWIKSATLAPASVAAGVAATETITLNCPAPSGGLTVTLGTSAPTVAQPVDGAKNPISSIVIPAGATVANVSISTFATPTTQTVTLSASNGGVTSSPTLTVTAGGAGLVLLPTAVIGGIGNSTGFVTLSAPAPVGGTMVTLMSSNPSAASVPANVKVKAGEESAAFLITSYSVTAVAKVNITATLGVSSVAVLTVNPVPVAPFGTLAIVPKSVTGGSNAIGLLTLAGAAPTSAVTVTLSSSNPSLVVPDTTVVIPAGQTSAWFDIQTSPVKTVTLVQVVAKLNGKTITAVITLTP